MNCGQELTCIRYDPKNSCDGIIHYHRETNKYYLKNGNSCAVSENLRLQIHQAKVLEKLAEAKL